MKTSVANNRDGIEKFYARGRQPVQVAAIYAVVGLIWIFGTDRLLLSLELQSGTAEFWIASAKGTLFVLLSAALVGWLVHLSMQSVTRVTGLLRAVVEETTDAVHVKDKNGSYLLVNEAACKFVGRTPEEIIGRSDFDLFPPEEAKRLIERDKRILAEGRVDRADEAVTGVGGRRIFSTIRAVFKDSGGQIAGIIGVSRDITDRIESEEKLRRSEARYRSLIEVLTSPFFIHSDDKINFCNPAFLRLVGLQREDQVIGHSPLDFVHPDFRDFVRARIALVRSIKAALPGTEVKLLRNDGQPVPVYAVSTLIETEDHPGVLVICNDLTERERSAELLRSVLASVKDSIITIDKKGIIRSINAATEAMFGYQQEELVGRKIELLMPEPHRTAHDTYIGSYLKTGQARIIGIGREVEALRKDGSRFPAELQVTQFTSDGESYFTGVMRDISDNRRLEDQYRQAQKMEAVGRLAGGVAHDFNNLLTVINGYCDLMLRTVPTHEPLHGQIASVRDAGEKAASLTAQLLAFSRKSIVELKILSLNSIINHAEKLLRRLIGEDVTVTVVLDPRLPEVRADIGQIDQLIMNLAVNARDAMPSGGRLTIATKRVLLEEELPNESGMLPAGEYAELTLSDNGSGMTEDIKGKIFEPFFTTKGEGQGTGLGLAVVYGIVKQAGGHISVESAVGHGTAFRILFPTAQGQAADRRLEVDLHEPRGHETILLIEDEPLVREIARLSLESQGYVVLEAQNEKEAAEAISSQGGRIQLLLTDVVMPEKSGLQIADEFRVSNPGLKVLFMSGYTDDAIMRYGVSQSTHAFIQKPFSPLGLAQKVREVLDR